jgi:ribosome biogenesis GTPase A
VTNTLKKDMILVLNKIDLAPAPLVLAWKQYFKTLYPSLQVLTFTSFPGYNLRDSNEKAGMSCNAHFCNDTMKFIFSGGLLVRRRRGKLRMAAEGAQQILQACENLVSGQGWF